MARRLFLIHWNKSEAEELAAPLGGLGWDVAIESEDGGRAGKLIRQNPPDAVVIWLRRLPSHGLATAEWLRSVKALRGLPMIFVDGAPEKVIQIRERVADAAFTTSDELEATLAGLLRADQK